MSLMKKVLLILFIVLLLGFAYSTKGNPDILKKDIIDACEGIDEFGGCITTKDIEPINESITNTASNIGTATANNLGIPDSAEILTILFLLFVLILIIVFFFKGVF